MIFQKKLRNIQVASDSFECSITADIAVFGFVDDKLKVLLTKRTVGDYKNHWLLPGGVLEVNETLEDCAAKVLFALTGFKNIHFEQVRTYSDLLRHPLKRVVTVSFCALVKPENHPIVIKRNVESIDWFAINEIPNNIGFDHLKLIEDATIFLKKIVEDRFVIKELLPEKFTLSELQALYEKILGIKLDKRNFRKRIFQKNILTNTEEKKIGVKGGAFLYSFRKQN